MSDLHNKSDFITSQHLMALMANIIDEEKPETILGTVAGADTLLVICKDEISAQHVEEEIKSFL